MHFHINECANCGNRPRYMLDGVRGYRQSEGRAELAVTFSLPSFRDYEAFSSVLRSQ